MRKDLVDGKVKVGVAVAVEEVGCIRVSLNVFLLVMRKVMVVILDSIDVDFLFGILIGRGSGGVSRTVMRLVHKSLGSTIVENHCS